MTDEAPDYALGFRSVDREYDGRPLPVEGTVPAWLDGALLRNGPGRFDVGGERVAHWFDGLAMLTRFGVADGSVTYSNRFLRSEAYRSAMEDGTIAGQFGTGGGLLSGLRDRLLPSPTDNANVNVLPVGDRHVAITETRRGIAFEPRTLETLGPHRFDDLEGQTMTAHPHIDPASGEVVTYTTHFGRTSRYRFYRRPAGGDGFRAIGSVPAERPAYLHSVGLTRGYIVLVEFPFDVSPLRLLLPGGGAFIERYDWRPEAGTRIVVLDRDSGAVVADRTHEPVFAFHHVNAYEDGDTVVADLAAFADPSIVESLYLEDLAAGPYPSVDGRLLRYRLPLDGDGVTAETLHPRALTLPRIAPGRNTRPYRYVYAQGTPDGERPQRLVKVDLEAGTARTWAEPDTFCGEPVVVPHPDGTAADEGVVLSVVLEAGAERSALLVLDAATFEERARAPLPHVVPFDFHGQFLPGR